MNSPSLWRLHRIITFIAAYFALFWFAWKAAVWLTEPGKRLAKLLRGAAEQKPK